DLSDARYYGSEEDLRNTLGDITIITAIHNAATDIQADCTAVYSLTGVKVGTSYRGITIQNGKKVIRK
ncbi:MAG: hypothetical protein HUK03_01580, partial [Bacteroidaceae bacterium]|nr:hypothetical protein [Bacteroidaceae bacterium]